MEGKMCVEDHWRQQHPLESFLSMNFFSSGGWILGMATGRNERVGSRSQRQEAASERNAKISRTCWKGGTKR